jgi:hypothetical protein
VRFGNWYLSTLHAAARRDAVVARAFHEVANLVTPPSSLLRPNLVLRVARGNLRPVDPAPTAVMEPAAAG